jgi:hypothetical protein
MADEQPRRHQYHAESTVLRGNLEHPLIQEIKPQSNVKLIEQGGYLSEHSEPYRLEGLISFEKAYTQVAGNDNPKPEGGWSTLVTSVIEKLNVLEVVTADRVIGQMLTLHPKVGYMPAINFLGTRFENLRINGYPVHVHFHRDHPYPLPDPVDDGPYTQHGGFLNQLKTQFELLRGSEGVSDALLTRYNPVPATTGSEEDHTLEETVELSIVDKVDASSLVDKAKGRSYCRCHGHVIYLKDFGEIHLGILKIKHSDYGFDKEKKKKVWKKTLFDLTMIELKMGCAAGGTSTLGNGVVNGGTAP